MLTRFKDTKFYHYLLFKVVETEIIILLDTKYTICCFL